MQQMTNHRPLAELDLLDDFLFNALLAYPEYGRKFCRKFLKILFGREFKNRYSLHSSQTLAVRLRKNMIQE